MEAFTTKGHWWLPGDDPDNAIAGILTFDPGGRSRLELFDSFGSFADSVMEGKSEPIILGIGENGQAVTLVDNLQSNSRQNVSNFMWSSSTYITHLVIQGQHFKHVDDIAFERLWLDFYGMEKWASTRKIWEPIDFNNFPTAQSTEDSIALSMGNFDIVIHRGFSFNGNPQSSFSVKRYSSVEIDADIPWGYEEVITRIFQFQVFLSLAMGTSTWPVSVKSPNPSNERQQITIHYAPYTDYQNKNDLFEFQMVFTLEEMHAKLESCLRKWFSSAEKLQQVIGLYNWTISKKIDLLQTFLALAKAIEAYHRLAYKKTYVSNTEFQKVYETLVNSIPLGTESGLKDRIVNSLKHVNSPSLRGRLNNIQKLYNYLNCSLFEDYDSFVNNVVGFRDYYTHFDEEAKPDANLEDIIVSMCERLKYILEICLLSELGLDDEEMQQLVKNMRRANPMSPALRPPQPDS